MTTLRDQVVEFHAAMDQPIRPSPSMIPDERVRLRAALIAEEFFETLEALFDDGLDIDLAKRCVIEVVEGGRVRIDMPALADGLADLDYVVEGCRVEMGINGGPIAAEVHRANMTKVGGPIAANGKRLKPPGWTPPDIEGELRKQGWR